VREEPAPATAALPRDLPEALDALEADEVLRSFLPPLLLETYVGAKRAEAAALNALAVDERHALYRSFY
jgi:glutamine synthetase